MRSFSRLACVVSADVMCGRDMYEENETDPFLTDLSPFRGVQVACDGVSMLGAPTRRFGVFPVLFDASQLQKWRLC